MRVTSLVENTSVVGLPVEHGLSLYLQLDAPMSSAAMSDSSQEPLHNILFDMGQGTLFAENAERLGLSIPEVDAAIISHGHYDHGGGLATFLGLNEHAKVYIQPEAFQPHYSYREQGLAYIGIDTSLQVSERLVLCGDVCQIDSRLTLFAHVQGDCCNPHGNRLLFGPGRHVRDTFSHEQNLLIVEGSNVVLIAGCAHCGIVNIMRRAEQLIGKAPTHVLAGMHLVKSGLREADEQAFIAQLARQLAAYPHCQYYTMHCTGIEQYDKLQTLMGDQICYLSCGESIVI